MKPNPLLFSILGVAAVLALTVAPRVSLGQASTDDPLLAPVITEIAKQQAQIIANQTKIDETLAIVAEDLRISRIYAGRGK